MCLMDERERERERQPSTKKDSSLLGDGFRQLTLGNLGRSQLSAQLPAPSAISVLSLVLTRPGNGDIVVLMQFHS